MERAEAIAAAVGAVQERWGLHSLTRGWSGAGAGAPRPVERADSGRPSWWPRASGLPRPRVVELVGPPSCGKLSLALLWLAEASEGGLVAVVDEARRFYPPAAAACGLDLERVVVVRPPAPLLAPDAVGLLLGSEGFDAVLWPVDSRTRLSSTAGARLAQLAGRSGTTLVTLVTSGTWRAAETHSSLVARRSSLVPADVRLGIVEWEWGWEDGEPGGAHALGGARLRVRTERMRGGAPERDWELHLRRQRGPDVLDGGDGDRGAASRPPDRLCLDAAFPVGGGGARAGGRARNGGLGGSAAGDLPPERACAGAG